MMAWASLMGMPPLIVLVTSLTDPAGAFQPQPSLSDYYYALPDGGVSRSLFVGFLVVLGSILLAYKGFDGAMICSIILEGFLPLGWRLFRWFAM